MTVSICHDESWSLVFSPLSTLTSVAPNPTEPLSPNRENAAATEAEEEWETLWVSEHTLHSGSLLFGTPPANKQEEGPSNVS